MATTSDRPRFRQDLVAEAIEDSGAKFIDVMDPDNGTLFRFYESEYSLACGMDGQRDVAGLVRWAEDELGLKPSQNEVRAVISTLGDLGFIDGVGEAARAPAMAEPPTRATPPPPPRPTPQPMPAVRAPTPPPTQPTSRWDQPTATGDADQ